MILNVAYASDDNFVRHAACSIYSLLDHNKDIEQIRVFMLSVGICDDYINKLNDIINKFDNASMEVIDLKDLKKMLGEHLKTGGWNVATMARFYLPSLLPEDVDRVMYIDCDTIINGSLSDIPVFDMKGCYAAAVTEPTVMPMIRQKCKLDKSVPYHNAGVMVIDLNKWREDDIQEKLIEFYRVHNDELTAPDQDTINIVLKDKIYMLSPKYNFSNVYFFYSYKSLSYFQKPAPFITKAQYDEANKKPVIIHFLGEDRPWRKGTKHPYSYLYEKYKQLTPWKDVKPDEGFETFLSCFNIFIKCTKPCQKLRLKLMHKMIPVVLNKRAKKVQAGK